jgi:hypothetical protein
MAFPIAVACMGMLIPTREGILYGVGASSLAVYTTSSLAYTPMCTVSPVSAASLRSVWPLSSVGSSCASRRPARVRIREPGLYRPLPSIRA